MNYYLQFSLYIICQLLPFIAGLTIWKKIDYASRIIVVIAGISVATECLAFYTAVRYQNNMTVYNIASLFIVSAMTVYFYYNLEFLRQHKLALILGAINVVVWVISIFIYPLNTENLIYTNYEIFVFIFLSVILMERLITTEIYSNLRSQPHFYFALLFILFWGITFIQWNLYDYMTVVHPHYKPLMDFSLSALSMLLNIGIFIVFINYSKMKHGKIR